MIPEERVNTASAGPPPPASRADGIKLSEIIYIIKRHIHTKPQALGAKWSRLENYKARTGEEW